MTRQNYVKNFIVFDIETTTFENEGKVYTDLYLASFLRVPFDVSITKSQLNSRRIHFVRSWKETEEYLKELSERIPKGKTQIIYCHNLAYEIDGIFKNISFLRDMFINHPEECETLFVKSRKPIFVRFGNIEFRCSFKLLNKNLRALGKLYDYNKLEIEYNAQYFSFSDLPEAEYQYNAKDVRLTAYAILQECKKYNFIKTIQDVPLTVTSFVRKNNIFINDKKTEKSFKQRNKYALEQYEERIDMLEQVYQGGYTHSNAFDTGKILMNITSIDITSSYPDSMLNRKYPYNFKFCKSKNPTSFFKYINSFNNYNLDYILNNVSQPFRYAYYGRFKIRNVKIKNFNDCNFPVISYSKVLNKPICTFDNGRIVYADEVEIYLNEIDYYLLAQFYDYELIEVSEFYYTNKFRKLHPFIINAIKQYAHEKTVFKNCLKIVSSENKNRRKLLTEDFYCDKIERLIIPEKEINTIISMTIDEQENTLGILLSTAKSNLNSIYGIMVQRIYQDEYKYLIELDEFEHEIDRTAPRNIYRNFEEGIYITAYSRLTLFTMALFLLDYGLRPVYSDTDSWKVQGEPDKVRKTVEKFNQIIEKSSHNSDFYNIGYFDIETTYKYFIGWGSKKYIAIEKTENGLQVFPTIAGVPKKRIAEVFTYLLNSFYQGDIIDFVDNTFKPNTVFRYSAIEKLSTKYYQNSFSGIVTDENGKSGKITFNNMVELFKTDYCLLDTNNKVNANYIRYLECVQNRKINTECSELCKEEGKYKVRYIPSYQTDYYLKSDYMKKLEEYL